MSQLILYYYTCFNTAVVEQRLVLVFSFESNLLIFVNEVNILRVSVITIHDSPANTRH